MKKIKISIFLIILLLLFVGCTNNNNKISKESETLETLKSSESYSMNKYDNKQQMNNLTLYEIFNVGDNSIMNGMVGLLMLENNLVDITKDSLVPSILAINYNEKKITTFIYKKGYSRPLSEFVNADSWADVLIEEEVTVYEFTQNDSGTSNLNLNLVTDSKGNNLRAEYIQFLSDGISDNSKSIFSFTAVGSIEETEIYGKKVKGFWGGKLDGSMNAIVTTSLNDFNLKLDDLNNPYGLKVDDQKLIEQMINR